MNELLDLTPEGIKQIEEWKSKYHDVYFTRVYDNDFIYRIPSPSEFAKLESETKDIYEFQERVCELYVLDPEVSDWTEDIPAGYVESLAKEIIAQSGVWWDKEKILEELDNANQPLNTLTDILPLVIKKAFPEYSFEDIKNWSLPRQFEYYRYAKWMINIEIPEFAIELDK